MPAVKTQKFSGMNQDQKNELQHSSLNVSVSNPVIRTDGTEQKDVLIIIPAYNEAGNLEAVHQDIRTQFPEADILFINDCSTDNTLEIIRSFDDIHYLNLPVNMGYFYAIQSGLKYAAQNKYKYVVQFDGDGQHLAREAKRMYEYACQNDVDIVIGSRFLEDYGYRHSFFRRVGTRMFQQIIKLLTGKTISDPTSGLQVLNYDVFSQLSKIYKYPDTADANLLINLLYNGYSIDELAVEMKNRETGESMHGGIIKPAKYMMKMFYYISVVYINHITGRKRVKQ